MRQVHRIICILTALSVLFCFCACNGEYTEQINRSVGFGNTEYESDCTIPIGDLMDSTFLQTTLSFSEWNESTTQTTSSLQFEETTITVTDFSTVDTHIHTTETTVTSTSALQDTEPVSVTNWFEAIPPYSIQPYATVNDNTPFFNLNDYPTEAFEYYSPLDTLGRCGECIACIGQELMPTEKREGIGMIKPSGWQLVRYDGIVEGNYLFNRCHLIGYQLTGENANLSNLITGTRYMNTIGMLPFENKTADYIRMTGNHVLYRVTPIFEGDNLLVTGVLMEAQSVEDNGAGLMFNVFCYNIQPQIFIDYCTGENYLIESVADNPSIIDLCGYSDEDFGSAVEDRSNILVGDEQCYDYILNTNTKRFHYTFCPSVDEMKDKNCMR